VFFRKLVPASLVSPQGVDGGAPRARTKPAATPALEVTIVINAAPSRVLKAFFEPQALNAWWQVERSVTTPRPLGVYAVQWDTTDYRDAVLGRLGGTFRGIVMQFDDGQGFFVADAFWLPPDGDPIGPMAFEVSCTVVESKRGAATRLRVVQSGFGSDPRSRRYHDVMESVWDHGLRALKSLLEP
jgi:uncharacterized protein YndB with AHSA1/START domain